jgi:hypothetical protein
MTELPDVIFIRNQVHNLCHGRFGYYYACYNWEFANKIADMLKVIGRIKGIDWVIHNAGISKRDFITEGVRFPEFKNKQDLLTFANIISKDFLVSEHKTTRDDAERFELGITKGGL